MRFKALLLGDVRFQFKYGFYFLYLVFTILYIALLYAFPAAWREKAAVLMIFSDPAAMGLFFMGAIVLFEKSERVLNSIAVSPVKPLEYVLSKIISLAVISSVVAFAIAIGGKITIHPIYFTLGVFLGSCLFSAIGLMIAANITTLNRFVVATVPAEIIINAPAIAWLFGWRPPLMLFHPGVCILELCENGDKALPAAFILAAWTVLFTWLAYRVMKKSLRALGGVKI